MPLEASAFQAILEAVEQGHDAPLRLDAALRKSRPPESGSFEWFSTTQRAGAVSRMEDLGLLVRFRQGRFMRYAITPRGKY